LNGHGDLGLAIAKEGGAFVSRPENCGGNIGLALCEKKIKTKIRVKIKAADQAPLATSREKIMLKDHEKRSRETINAWVR